MSWETLCVIWFVLEGVLLAGYALLDGFDLGVGILHPFVPRTDRERRVSMNSIGPLWDGNEVWLVTFGGALFAAFRARADRVSRVLIALSLFWLVLFFGRLVSAPGWLHWLTGFLVWFVLVALTVVIRNTTPRVRTDQAVRFFWGPVSLLALLAVLLAWAGL